MALFSTYTAQAAPPESGAVPPGPHRVRLSSGIGATISGADDDGHHDTDGLGIGLRAAYGYRPVRGLELGAGLAYWNADMDVRHILFGSGEVRGYLPLGDADQLELGLALRLGYLAMLYPDAPEDDLGSSDRVWSGIALGLAADLHYWYSPSLALVAALDLNAGGGGDHSDEGGYYLPERASVAAVTGWLGIATSW